MSSDRIITYVPEEGDGQLVASAIESAMRDRDDLVSLMMLDVMGPALSQLLDLRVELEAEEYEFFAGVSASMAEFIVFMIEAVVDQGKEPFAKAFLKVINGLVVQRYGTEVLPSHEEVMSTIREGYN